MNKIKRAFNQVRQDIDYLYQEIEFIKSKDYEIQKINQKLIKIEEILNKLIFEINSTNKIENSTNQTQNQTIRQVFKPRKSQNLPISTGNEGASTDRQTNQQTDRHIEKQIDFNKNNIQSMSINEDNFSKKIKNAEEIFDSLDNIKKELRIKFKRLTNQEFLVFSTIYQLEEEKGYTNYKELSDKLNLSESSIRDYIGRIIKKQIPLEKIKINNKNIHLKIDSSLKKIASLPTIIHLKNI